MKKNFIIVLMFTALTAFSSCSHSEDEPNIENNILVNTVWKRPYYAMSGPLVGYEVLKFPSKDVITRTIEDLNGITREYRWVGSYKINGEKIICSINSQTIELIMNPNNTICIPSETGECFVKQ